MKSWDKLVWNQETQSACRAAVLEDKLKNLRVGYESLEMGVREVIKELGSGRAKELRTVC